MSPAVFAGVVGQSTFTMILGEGGDKAGGAPVLSRAKYQAFTNDAINRANNSLDGAAK